MGLRRDTYIFTEFAERWAAERGNEVRDLAVIIAKAIHDQRLKHTTEGAFAGGPSDREPTPYGDDHQAQALDAAIEDHIWRVAGGKGPPNSDLLRHVELRRDDLEKWLKEIGEPLPSFMRPIAADDTVSPASPMAEAGERKFENVHKIVAILAILLAETDDRFKFKASNNIKMQELFDDIEAFLKGEAQLAELLGEGLGKSVVFDVIGRALDPLKPWLTRPKGDSKG